MDDKLDSMTPTVNQIRVYPVKSLDPLDLNRAEITANGALSHDREFAILDPQDNYINGKREPKIHCLSSEYIPSTKTLHLRSNDTDSKYQFNILTEKDNLEIWLSDFFGYPVRLKQDSDEGFPDDEIASGPTVISTATIETVASWFNGISTEEMRRRLRPNIEISNTPAFWEDQLYTDRSHSIAFQIGKLELQGTNPCSRCVVPTRDPDTGEEYSGFQETFVQQRQETLPKWANRDWFGHYFKLMVNTIVPLSGWKKVIEIGDPVRIIRKQEGNPQ